MVMQKQKAIQNSLLFSLGTFFSRVSGYLRDVTMAFFLGASSEVASFLLSFRISHLLRRVIAETPLSSSLMPTLYDEKQKKHLSAFYFYYGFLLLALVALLEGVVYASRSFISSSLLRSFYWMIPSLFFLCLSSFHHALMQSKRYFFLSGLSPILINCSWITGVLYCAFVLKSTSVEVLSISILGGFILQWALTFTMVSDLLVHKPQWFRLEHLMQFLAPFFWGVLGIGSSQLNTFIDAVFSKLASGNGPAILWYAARIYQIPVAFIGVAMSAAYLPELCEEKDAHNRQNLLSQGLNANLRFTLLFIVLYFALSQEIVGVLFGHGAFSESNVQTTSIVLLCYTLGLIPSSLTLLMSQHYFAQKEHRKVANITLIAVFINCLLNGFFVFLMPGKVEMIALATSLTQWVQFFLIKKRISFHLSNSRKTLLLSALILLLGIGMRFFCQEMPVFLRFLSVGVCLGVLFLFFGRVASIEEWLLPLTIMKRKIFRSESRE